MLGIFSFVFKSSICKMKESFWSELGYDLWLMMSSPDEPLCLEKPFYLYLLGPGCREIFKNTDLAWPLPDRCHFGSGVAAVWLKFGTLPLWQRLGSALDSDHLCPKNAAKTLSENSSGLRELLLNFWKDPWLLQNSTFYLNFFKYLNLVNNLKTLKHTN